MNDREVLKKQLVAAFYCRLAVEKRCRLET